MITSRKLIEGGGSSNWAFSSGKKLHLLDIFEAPIWIFDIEKHGMWWANQAAIRFWQATSLDDLLNRDYSSDSSTVRKRLRQIFDNAPLGQPTLDSWTLYPAGNPVPANLRYTPVQIDSDHRDALLIEASISENEGIDATDLRTPLNAILGFSDILSTETTQKLAAQRFREYGLNIHMAADSLLTLVNDLLDLSRIEADQFPIHPETVILRPLLADTMEIFRDSFDARNISLALEPGPDVSVISDARAVSQILTNLLSNGLKYTEPTGRVSLSLAAPTPVRPTLIKVMDTGRGIPPEELSYVFDPYFRGSADVAREINGTGLGLPICKRLAELISADLEIESRVSVGTTVSLFLPAEIQAAPAKS